MRNISCTILVHSNSGHIQQLFTGFLMLHRRGLINLKQRVIKKNVIDLTKPPYLQDARHAHLHVILNDSLHLHYDMHDSQEIDQEYLQESHFYFKRSYSSSLIKKSEEYRKKIFPFGLYYPVYPENFDKYAFTRIKVSGNTSDQIKAVFRSFPFLDRFYFTPRVSLMESLPEINLQSKVLFMAKAFNPYDRSDRIQKKVEERRNINDFRARCIRLLRKKFGSVFYGGFWHSDYAQKNYRDLLLPDIKQSSKRKYINRLKYYPICIATKGLHESIGAKFAEYIAFSKAIVTERMNFEIPGTLEEGNNYLSFNTPEECVENVERLFSDLNLRNQMMINNSKYYHSYLRPDSLLLNTILTTLSYC